MSTTPDHPRRVRLYGGRNTHAARDLLGGDHETACGYFIADGSTTHWMPPSATVTCPACKRKTGRITR
ncbi:hypothetical protein [Streptomyces sp. NPDC001889]